MALIAFLLIALHGMGNCPHRDPVNLAAVFGRRRLLDGGSKLLPLVNSDRTVMTFSADRVRFSMRMEQSTLIGQTINLDSNEYIRCTFKQCRIVFSGTGPVSLIGNTFDECEWAFEGPAATTIQFMTMLYQSGGGARSLMERTIENMKSDAIR